MKPLVSLSRVVEELESMFDNQRAYLNQRTGEIVSLFDEHVLAAEDLEDPEQLPDWERSVVEKAREVLDDADFLRLPDAYDIHEYEIMHRFCRTLEDPELSDELISLIQGSGAFRRFKNAVQHYGLTDDWYHFRARAIEEIAVEWLEANDIPYRRESR